MEKKKTRKTKKAKKTKKVVKKTARKTKKRVKKSMKGGDTNWGQTGFPLNYYDPSIKVADYPMNSGMGANTAYGPANPRDVGMGNLAPYNVAANGAKASNQQTGGRKKTKKTVRKTKKTIRKTKKRVKKSMKGGDTNWGQTGFPLNYYDPSLKVADYPMNSGMGANTAYGPANPRDVGMGNLAPYNVAANGAKASNQQTGGNIADEPVKSIVNGIESTIDSINEKFALLNANLAKFNSTMSSALNIQSGGLKIIGGKNMDQYTGAYSPRWEDNCFNDVPVKTGGKKKRKTVKKAPKKKVKSKRSSKKKSSRK